MESSKTIEGSHNSRSLPIEIQRPTAKLSRRTALQIGVLLASSALPAVSDAKDETHGMVENLIEERRYDKIYLLTDSDGTFLAFCNWFPQHNEYLMVEWKWYNGDERQLPKRNPATGMYEASWLQEGIYKGRETFVLWEIESKAFAPMKTLGSFFTYSQEKLGSKSYRGMLRTRLYMHRGAKVPENVDDQTPLSEIRKKLGLE